MQETVWIEPDNTRVYAARGGTSSVSGGGVTGCVGADSVCMEGVFVGMDWRS